MSAENYSGGGASDDRGWIDGWDLDTMRSTCTYPLQDSQQNEISTQNETLLFGSAHSGGLNAVFADGSVHTINYDIDLYVFNSLGTRNGESTAKRPTPKARIDAVAAILLCLWEASLTPMSCPTSWNVQIGDGVASHRIHYTAGMCSAPHLLYLLPSAARRSTPRPSRPAST